MARWRMRLRLGVLTAVLVASVGAVAGAAVPPAPGDGLALTSPGPWGWPLEPAPAVARRFEPSPTPWGAGHRGVDLVATAGQPVLAAGAGVVSFSGVVAGRGVVTVTHRGGLRTTYEPVRTRVPAGTTVLTGTPIGRVDVTPGHCAPATCLHWGLVRGSGPAAIYVDPLTLLPGAAGPPVLLPFVGLGPSAWESAWR